MSVITENRTVVRTSRGLSVVGKRITLYDIMDYVKAGWATEEIRDVLRLTDEQINDCLDYIETNREEVEAEYQQVLREAEENRKYWEEKNRERFERIKNQPPKNDFPELRAKIEAKKKELGLK
jgi:uncharacterized protein (DUF433 family)